MSGSESKTERETRGSSPSENDRTSLADFLAPPRPRSVPAPAREHAEVPGGAQPSEIEATPPSDAPASADASTSRAEPQGEPVAAIAIEAAPTSPTVATDTEALAVKTTSSDAGGKEEAANAKSEAEGAGEQVTSEATTPTEPTTVSEVPPAPVAAIRASEPRYPSVAPPSTSDAAARSLIPVATSDSDAPKNEGDEFDLPGAGAPLSGAAIRRVTFVALLAAAAAVPAWVVFRARSVDVQPRTETAAGSKPSAAAAGPSTLGPAREIEADDDQDDPGEPPAAAVPIDPAKALEVRREARRLLEAGQIEPGVAAARNAIALNPADPESYVLLAAGLQDMGRWAESREVFSRCVHKSKDGINAECVYFATSGTLTNR